jgi:hypothetical protein
MPIAPVAVQPDRVLTDTPAPAPTPAPGHSAPVGFFQKSWPAALILAAFPLIALPMVAVVLLYPLNWLIWGYVWLFGMTHFVITLAVYARGPNLRHFASSPRNRLIFFYLPAVFLVGFDLYHALRVGAIFPGVGLLVLIAVRLADFNHFNRQSFGVLQLFKARTGAKCPPELKRAENLYFCALTALLFVTFVAGGTCPLLQPGGPLSVGSSVDAFFPGFVALPLTQPLWAGLLAITAGLFVWVALGLWRAAGDRAGFASVAGYLLVQTAAVGLAAVYFPLYFAALAVHYVEYHVLMARRCLQPEAKSACRLDRTMNVLRARPVAFYLAVLAVAGLVVMATRAGMGMMGLQPGAAGEPFAYLAVIAVFDGLFVFHYFVEMFIWRFSDPHFRRELAGLYFAPARENGK